MNREAWHKSAWIKTILIIVCIASVMLGSLSVCAFAYFYQQGVRPSDSADYFKSEEMPKELYSQTGQLLEAIGNSQILDWDKDTVSIDMYHAVEATRLSLGTDSGLSYKWDDLYQWAREDVKYNDNVLICTQPDGQEYYIYLQDFKKKIESGEWKFVLEDTSLYTDENLLDELENQEILDNLEGLSKITDKNGKELYTNVAKYEEYVPEELYKPIGADSILDILNEDENWQGRVDDAFTALTNTLDAIYKGIQAEEDLTSGTYAKGNTNLNYVYWDQDENRFYTNTDLTSGASLEKKLSAAIGENPYMVLKPTLSDCSTNLKQNDYSLESWQHMFQAEIFSITNRTPEKYVCAVWLNKDLPVADSYAEKIAEYQTGVHWMVPAIVYAAICAVLFLFSMVRLTRMAGHTGQDDEIHLNWFDCIYTEIAAAIVLIFWGLWGLCMDVADELAGSGTNVGITMDNIIFFILALAFWTALWFLIGWLSLVRRIKAKTLWKNSLLYKILHLCTLPFCWIRNRIFPQKRSEIIKGLEEITAGNLQYKIPTEKLKGEQLQMAEMINNIGDGLDAAVEKSVKNERMKTELITNVSHDIKTPLTSIINYVDLLKRENFTDPKVLGYLEVLDEKSKRLKILTEDVVEASKASTGNITMEMTDLNFDEIIHQVIGEYEERFTEKGLTLIRSFETENAVIFADGRRLWRVLENVFKNVEKYAMENTRVYAELREADGNICFSLKNISAQPLNISADELTERFIRGDVARSTEGSGLGLSIAKSLTELMGGSFELYLDGDLFKVNISFPKK